METRSSSISMCEIGRTEMLPFFASFALAGPKLAGGFSSEGRASAFNRDISPDEG